MRLEEGKIINITASEELRKIFEQKASHRLTVLRSEFFYGSG
jgi:hypothetical protein